MGDEQREERREAIIRRVLEILEHDEVVAPGGLLAAVLSLRRNRPKAKVEDLAREFSIQIGSPVSPETFRILLQRARRRFLDLLAEEGYDFRRL